MASVSQVITGGIANAAKQTVKATKVLNISSVVNNAAKKYGKTTAKAAQTAAKTQQKNSSTQTAAPATTAKTTTINYLLEWDGVKFYANASQVVGFRDLNISASCETEDKTNGGFKYVALKNKKGFEVTFTAFLDVRLGVADVRGDALALANKAATGNSAYIYCLATKLVPQKVMATGAKIKNIQMTPGGKWICCEIEMTLKGCEKLDGSGSTQQGGGGGYKYGCTVYYSMSSGAIKSVWAGSNVSQEDAKKKAWAKVPATAHWASETKSQATNQSPKLTDAALEAARKRLAASQQQQESAKTDSSNKFSGITLRVNQVKEVKKINIDLVR